jgi:hypothetical protein
MNNLPRSRRLKTTSWHVPALRHPQTVPALRHPQTVPAMRHPQTVPPATSKTSASDLSPNPRSHLNPLNPTRATIFNAGCYLSSGAMPATQVCSRPATGEQRPQHAGNTPYTIATAHVCHVLDRAMTTVTHSINSSLQLQVISPATEPLSAPTDPSSHPRHLLLHSVSRCRSPRNPPNQSRQQPCACPCPWRAPWPHPHPLLLLLLPLLRLAAACLA